MFVVRRSFRDASGMVSAGSIVEPADIKRFKHRMLEGHIVEVNEQNFNEYANFFKAKLGIELPQIVNTTDEQNKEVTAKAEPAKPVKQVTVKKAVATSK